MPNMRKHDPRNTLDRFLSTSISASERTRGRSSVRKPEPDRRLVPELSDDSDDFLEGVRLGSSHAISSPKTARRVQSVPSSNHDSSLSPPPTRQVKRKPSSPSRSRSSIGQSAQAEHDHLTSSSSSLEPVLKRNSPRKRRRVVRGKAGQSSNDPSGEDLAEVDADKIVETRFRAPQISQFSKNLERMKRKKALKELRSSEDGSNDESSDGDDPAPFKDAVPPGGRISSPSDVSDNSQDCGAAKDDEFIVDDESEHEVAILPVEFSMRSHSDLPHHFKVICQYFVHLAVLDVTQRRAFIERTRRDEYFRVPISTVRRKLQGLNDSMVASSIWKSEFRQRLDVHPIRKSDVMSFTVPLCDACCIRGRIATISFAVSGRKYDRESFEAVESDEDDEDEVDASPDGVTFCLGKFCARRAKVYHQLAHWEYALFSRLEQEVRDLQRPGSSRLGNFVRVNWGDPSEIPENIGDPDQIMDWLDKRRVITDEYHKIKGAMEHAQNIEAPDYRD